MKLKLVLKLIFVLGLLSISQGKGRNGKSKNILILFLGTEFTCTPDLDTSDSIIDIQVTLPEAYDNIMILLFDFPASLFDSAIPPQITYVRTGLPDF
jgi:hypothetical protein